MKATVIALAVSLVALSAAECQAREGGWTVHTVSAHVATRGLNNFNPGIAYDVRDDLRVGGLYNSYEKPSFYVAKLFNVRKRFRAGLGIISGYTWDQDERDVVGKTSGILPFVAAEFDLAPGVSLLWFGEAFNLEVKF